MGEQLFKIRSLPDRQMFQPCSCWMRTGNWSTTTGRYEIFNENCSFGEYIGELTYLFNPTVRYYSLWLMSFGRKITKSWSQSAFPNNKSSEVTLERKIKNSHLCPSLLFCLFVSCNGGIVSRNFSGVLIHSECEFLFEHILMYVAKTFWLIHTLRMWSEIPLRVLTQHCYRLAQLPWSATMIHAHC